MTPKAGEKVDKQRLTQELRLAGITEREQANEFLRKRYIDEFNGKFCVASAAKGTAFRRSGRTDLDWIFTVQTERVVAKDKTVAIGDRLWQIDKTRFRSSLAGCTVTIHEHLNGEVSMRYGPHVIGRFNMQGKSVKQSTANGTSQNEAAGVGAQGRGGSLKPAKGRWKDKRAVEMTGLWKAWKAHLTWSPEKCDTSWRVPVFSTWAAGK